MASTSPMAATMSAGWFLPGSVRLKANRNTDPFPFGLTVTPVGWFAGPSEPKIVVVSGPDPRGTDHRRGERPIFRHPQRQGNDRIVRGVKASPGLPQAVVGAVIIPRHPGGAVFSLQGICLPGQSRRERDRDRSGRGAFFATEQWQGFDSRALGRQGFAMTFQQVPPKPSALPEQVVLRPNRAWRHPHHLRAHGRRGRMAGLRHVVSQQRGDFFGLPPRRRAPDLPHREATEAQGPAGACTRSSGWTGRSSSGGTTSGRVLRIFDRKLIRAVND